MDDIVKIRELTFELYDRLIKKVIDNAPLTEREQIAYYGLDFYIRLEMSAFDGIMQNPQPFIDSLMRVGLMDHARKLQHAVRLGPARLDRIGDEREECDRELSEMARAHFDGDNTVFERAVYAFWMAGEEGPLIVV